LNFSYYFAYLGGIDFQIILDTNRFSYPSAALKWNPTEAAREEHKRKWSEKQRHSIQVVRMT